MNIGTFLNKYDLELISKGDSERPDKYSNGKFEVYIYGDTAWLYVPGHRTEAWDATDFSRLNDYLESLEL